MRLLCTPATIFDMAGVNPSTALRTGAALTDAEGNALESEEAVETLLDSGRWVYTAAAAVETGTAAWPKWRKRRRYRVHMG
jgi:hypothetical protein